MSDEARIIGAQDDVSDDFWEVIDRSIQRGNHGLQKVLVGHRRAKIVETLLAAHPRIKSIQVDGGSEFMAEFEAACRDLGLTLFVLPPRSPRLNGCVERANDASRTEFWALYSGELTVAEAAPALAKFQHFHNTVRPHMSLDWKTPFEYLSSALGLPAQSHMC